MTQVLTALKKYVKQAPLYGESFTMDSAEVHTYLVNLTSGNNTVKVKMLLYGQSNDS